MGIRKDAAQIARWRRSVENEALTLATRFESARTWLEERLYSTDAVDVCKRFYKSVLSNPIATPQQREKAGKMLAEIDTMIAVPKDQRVTLIGPKPLTESQSKPDPVEEEPFFEHEDTEQKLSRINASARRTPNPQMFLYFPSGDFTYLIEQHSDVFPTLETIHKEQLDHDPYNALPDGKEFNRTLNPFYVEEYQRWKELKGFGAQLPELSSRWGLRFFEEEEARRYNSLHTLMAPEEYPVGAELRRRQHMAGEVKTWEIPFTRTLWFEMLLATDESTKGVFPLIECPVFFETEFQHVILPDEVAA